MDIWNWVRTTDLDLRRGGNHRLADLVENLSHAVCAGRHAQVDAMVPEALALARAAKSPWLEVFIRHWYMQSKIFHRCEVNDALPEAVSLLEFASREEARECPQSVCVTQDLAQCYAQLDGPGYVDERLAVAGETLARIDPGWPCFACIGDEYASALIDARRFDEVLAFVSDQRRALAVNRFMSPRGQFCGSMATALLALGRPEEALAEAEQWEVTLAGRSTQIARDLLRGLALLRLGRTREAAPLLPSAQQVLDLEDNYVLWARCVRDLAASYEIDWSCSNALWTMHDRMLGHGALYGAATIARLAAEIAISRGARRSAELGLAAAREIVPKLRAPAYLEQQLAALDERAAAIPPPDAPDGAYKPALDESDTPEALLERLGEDPQRELDVLTHARKRWPEHLDLALWEARALQSLGHLAESERLLWAIMAEHTDSMRAFFLLATTLLSARAFDRLEALLATFGDSPPAPIWQLRVEMEDQRGDRDACVAALEKLLEVSPDDHTAASALAEFERDRGNWARALAILDDLVADAEPGAADWDRMVAATVLGDWARVRASAERLGLELSDPDPGPDGASPEAVADRPIDERWEPLLLRVSDEWREQTVLAQRTGPVTARVIEMAGPGETESFGDVWVFDPTPLHPGGEDDDADEDDAVPRLRAFSAIHSLSRAELVTYQIDGVHPGEDAVAALAAAIAERGGTLRVRSDDSYRIALFYEDEVEDEDDDDESGTAPGLHAYVAMPRSMPLAEVHAIFLENTRGYEHPLTWRDLAEDLGDPDEIARQAAIAERYDV